MAESALMGNSVISYQPLSNAPQGALSSALEDEDTSGINTQKKRVEICSLDLKAKGK